MKNTNYKFNFIAIVAIIGLGFTACGGGDSGGVNGGGCRHEIRDYWSYNATQHWRSCYECDAKIEPANHSPMDGICTTCEWDNTPPCTHTLEHGICTICGYGTITHTYSSEWSCDDKQHWKECTFTGCDSKTQIANHQYNYYTVTSTSYPAQSTATCGVVSSYFSGCGYTGGARDTIIGDRGPAGGTIFHVAPSGFTVTGADSFTAYYLEAAPTNQTTSTRWSGSNIDVTGAKGIEKGTGKANTAAIIAAHSGDTASNNAAIAAAAYTGGGKDDWFLPSRDELMIMYLAKGKTGIPTTGWFWSSSQAGAGHAYIYYFANSAYDSVDKRGQGWWSDDTYVRAIRAF